MSNDFTQDPDFFVFVLIGLYYLLCQFPAIRTLCQRLVFRKVSFLHINPVLHNGSILAIRGRFWRFSHAFFDYPKNCGIRTETCGNEIKSHDFGVFS